MEADEVRKMKVYVVEVGVLLDKTNEEYASYALKIGKGVGEKSIYNEDTLGFATFGEAKKYVDYYVEVGVPSTYGFIWLDDVSFNSEVELEEFKSNATLPHWEYEFENILYWKEKGGKNSG